MTSRKLRKIARELAALRQSQPKSSDLEALALGLGRKKVNRGKEPTYESKAFPELRPLAIPSHKGRDLPIGTKNSILTQLEDDIIAWEERLESDPL